MTKLEQEYYEAMIRMVESIEELKEAVKELRDEMHYKIIKEISKKTN